MCACVQCTLFHLPENTRPHTCTQPVHAHAHCCTIECGSGTLVSCTKALLSVRAALPCLHALHHCAHPRPAQHQCPWQRHCPKLPSHGCGGASQPLHYHGRCISIWSRPAHVNSLVFQIIPELHLLYACMTLPASILIFLLFFFSQACSCCSFYKQTPLLICHTLARTHLQMLLA